MSAAATEDSTAVRVNLGERSYEILIGADLIAGFPERLLGWLRDRCLVERPATAMIVTDENVAAAAGDVGGALTQAGWNVESFAMTPGEQAKNLDTVKQVYDQMIARRCDRSGPVIAVGGGVVGDTAGYVAATYVRGVPFVQIPTTLLAAVDSSVGGKVGVNHELAKNMIGAFHQPAGVVIDVKLLRTLPERDYRSGLAEVVKYGVILDEPFFSQLESLVTELQARQPAALTTVIRRSCELKAFVVERDEFERTGLRATLNYGHTFAHAFEALCGYGRLTHGEAVSIGMVCASRLAEAMQRIDGQVTARQEKLLSALQLPTRLPEECEIGMESVLERMLLDKKTVAGQLRFVLPTRMGHVETVREVDPALVRDVLGSVGCR